MSRRSGGASEARTEADWVLAGRAWVGGRLQSVEVGISEEGDIVRVARTIRASRRVDLGESVLIPSAVDLHVHFRDPAPPGAAETISDGTLQAVHGGVGAVGDMPNTEPPIRTVEDLEAKESRARRRSACHLVLYAQASRPAAVRRLAGAAGALKLYTAPTTGVPEPPPAAEWPELFGAVRATGLALAAHAEDPAEFVEPPRAPEDLPGWDAARPESAERSSVERLIASAGPARLHIAHATQEAVVDRVARAGYCCEATPHHLLLSSEVRDLGTAGKVNPPLRGEATRRRLWEAFRTGRIPILASDHAPHAESEKARPFPLAPSGVPGVETMIPLMLARVARAELSLPVLQAAACDRPARWFGLPMGRLSPGHRASLLAVDFRRRIRLRSGALHAPEARTPFEGREAVFPLRHYLDGEPVVDLGEYVGRRQGRVLRPDYARH